MGNQDGSNEKVPAACDVVRVVKDFEAKRTKEGTLDLTTLETGDQVEIEFYPDEETLVTSPPLKLTIMEPPNPKENKEATAVADWEGIGWKAKKIRVFGSRFSPQGSMRSPNAVIAGLFLEMHAFDPRKAKLQEQGGLPIDTIIGELTVDEYVGMSNGGLKRDVIVDRFCGWDEKFSPQIASFTVDKISE